MSPAFPPRRRLRFPRSARRVPAHSRPDQSAARDESSPDETSTGVSVAQYCAPPAPVPSDWWRPTLPVSLLLQCFATQDFALDLVTTQSHLVATQRHRGPGRGHLALIWQNFIQTILILLCPVLQGLMLCQWCLKSCSQIRAGLRHPQSSPVSTECLRRLWTGETLTWILSMCSLCLRRLRDLSDIYPLSHLSRHRSHLRRLPHELLAASSCDSVSGSLSTSLSITDHTAHLRLLTTPLILLPDTVLHTDPAIFLEPTQTYHDFLPPQVPEVDTPQVPSRDGPFDASTEPTATRDHPFIFRWPGRLPLSYD